MRFLYRIQLRLQRRGGHEIGRIPVGQLGAHGGTR